MSLHSLVCESSLLIQVGTKHLLVPVITDEVKQHIMECAAVMRALQGVRRMTQAGTGSTSQPHRGGTALRGRRAAMAGTTAGEEVNDEH